MVKCSKTPLDATFAALADATRRGILARLAHGEASFSDLAAPYDMSLPAVSKHLRVLERAKLVARRKDGRVSRCRLVADPMKEAAQWIEHYRQFWEQQLDALARFLEKSPRREDGKTWQHHHRAPRLAFKSGGCSLPRAPKSSKRGPNANN